MTRTRLLTPTLILMLLLLCSPLYGQRGEGEFSLQLETLGELSGTTTMAMAVATAPNGTNENWLAGIGTAGASDPVKAATWEDGKLFIGGNFRSIGGKTAGYVGMWDGTAWNTLGGGLDGEVEALVVNDGKLYVGGDFTSAGGTLAKDIAVYDIASGTWSALGRGIGGILGARVHALAHDGENLFVGGQFIVSGTTVAVNLAMWNGSEWKRVGSGADRPVYALHVDGDNLYAGGEFRLIGDIRTRGVAHYTISTNTWEAMPGLTFESSGIVTAITSDEEYVYIGGRFSVSNGSSMNNVARFNRGSGNWDNMKGGVTNERKGSPIALAQDPDGIGPIVVHALAFRGNDLFVGGDFDNLVSDPRLSDDDASNQPRDMVKWNRTTESWSMFPRTSAISGDVYASSGVVKSSRTIGSAGDLDKILARDDNSTVVAAFAPAPDGAIFIAGSFDFAGPVEVVDDVAIEAARITPDPEAVFATNLALLSGNDTVWSAIGDTRLDGRVETMVDDGTWVYVGGGFSRAGTEQLRGIARLEKSSGRWVAMNGGLARTGGGVLVEAIEKYGDKIYVGGDFTTAGGAPISGLAAWDPAANSWSDVGGKSFTRVTGLASNGTRLAVVGAHGLAIWDGVTWTDVPETITGSLFDVAIDGSNYYVGGTFSMVGSQAASNVAVWNREVETWETMAGGLPDTVYAIEAWDEYIYFGGNFRHFTGTDIVRWNRGPKRWERIGNGLLPTTAEYSVVTDLHLGRYGLYVGGDFNGFGSSPVTNKATSIALWDGSTWRSLGNGLTKIVGRGSVSALASDNERLHVASEFDFAGTKPAGGYADWIFPEDPEEPAGEEEEESLRPEMRFAAAEKPDDIYWDDRFDPSATPPGLDDEVFTLVSNPEGDGVYAGGAFLRAVGADISGIAYWDGTEWLPLDDGTDEGVDGFVFAMAMEGDNLYVAGQFTRAGGIRAENIAVWNRRSETWSALGDGVNTEGGAQPFVSALTIADGKVYVGGTFTLAGGAAARNVAVWDGSSWAPLSSGIDGSVNALEAHDGNIYAGGTFGTAGGKTVSNLAFWDGSAWQTMGAGVDGLVNDFEVFRDRLIFGGIFTIGGEGVNLATWDGSNVSRFTHQSEKIDEIRALFVDGDRIYTGGDYEFEPDPTIDQQKFTFGPLRNTGFQIHDETSSFTPWTPMAEGANGPVNAFARINGEIIVGGSFRTVGPDDTRATSVAGWSIESRSWFPLNGGAQLTAGLSAMALVDGTLYAAGPFRFSTDPRYRENQVARLGSGGWRSEEGSLQGRAIGLTATASKMFIGGTFYTGGDVIAVNIIEWDPESKGWNALKSGSGVASHSDQSSVIALEARGDLVYVGGEFDVVDTFATANIALYNRATEEWQALGEGLNGKVWALGAGENGQIYAGGDFRKSGTTDLRGLACWNGSTWEPLGNGIQGDIRSLAVLDGRVFVGGTFGMVDGMEVDNIAAWNIAEKKWERAGNGLTGDLLPGVDVLRVIGGRLFAGGFFRRSGEDSVRNVARYNGFGWEALGSGANFAVYTMAGDEKDIYIAGSFDSAGAKPSPFIALWHDPTLSVERIESPVSGLLTGGPNPFDERMRIRFSVPRPGPVTIEIYDASGVRVEEIFSGDIETGESVIDWLPSASLASGVYYCRMTTDEGVVVVKVVRQR